MPSPVRVLIVDDCASFRDAVSTLLDAEGYEVLTAGDGSEASKLLAESSPDVLISDQHIDKVPGYEFLAVVYLRFPHSPMIATSSSFKRHELSSGIVADAFLHKEALTFGQLCFKIIELIAACPINPQSIEGKTASVWVSRNPAGYVSLFCTHCQGSFKLVAVGLNGGIHSGKCPSCKADVKFQIDHSMEELQNKED